ncbi:MAG TPA: ADP-ribosylglycohydrolase family protein [Planctomycetota bacterium]|nr:ADP-ribosylglycohydrolase family protein [Planctomycetota bacterium]
MEGGILGLVVGDALGVPVEFKGREECHVSCMSGHGTHHQLPGTWSDDSSLALATADALMQAARTDEIDFERIMKNFLRWRYERFMTARGAVFDVGITTHMAIDRFRDGSPALQCGGAGEGENGNGSLMRILPLSIFVARWPIERIVKASFDVSALTHAHVRSQLCCGFYSLLIRDLLEGRELRQAVRHCAELIKPFTPADEAANFERVLSGNVFDCDRNEIQSTGYVIHTLEASLWCCANSADFKEAVLKAVNLGDDTDTTGAVTGAIAGTMYGKAAIPQEWIDALARGGDVQKIALQFANRLCEK